MSHSSRRMIKLVSGAEVELPLGPPSPERQCISKSGSLHKFPNEHLPIQRIRVQSLQRCWREYVAGGVGKWTWFMPLILGFHQETQLIVRPGC